MINELPVPAQLQPHPPQVQGLGKPWKWDPGKETKGQASTNLRPRPPTPGPSLPTLCQPGQVRGP